MHLSPALEGRRGEAGVARGPEPRALGSPAGARASAEAPEPRGQSGLVRGADTRRLREALESPLLGALESPSWEPRAGQRRQRTPPALAQPGRLFSTQREGSPGARRAQSWVAGGLRLPWGASFVALPRRSRGAPSPGSPAPPPDPARVTGTKGNKISNPPSRFRRDFNAAAGARPGGGTLGRGRSGGGRPSPYQPRAGSRAETSRLPRLPHEGSLPLPSPLRLRGLETFSCSGREESCCPRGRGMRSGSRWGQAAAARQ